MTTTTAALVAESAGAPFVQRLVERRALRDDDVAIDIKYAGICHSDIHQAREEWGKAIFSDLCVILRPQARAIPCTALFLLSSETLDEELRRLEVCMAMVIPTSCATVSGEETAATEVWDSHFKAQGPEDVANFLKYAIALTRVHLQLARLITPVVHNR